MTRWIVIDTETTGMFDFKRPADDEDQPRLAEFAGIKLDEDLNVEEEFHRLILPDGWELSEEAAAANNLTMEMLHERGVPVAEVLDWYTTAVGIEERAVAAHNAQFDCKMVRAEFRRVDRDDMFERTPNYCTMRKLVGVCKLPQKNRGGYRWPKLAEACDHFYIPHDGAHTALGDARACVGLLRKIAEIGLDIAPQVHYAKNPPKKKDAD